MAEIFILDNGAQGAGLWVEECVPSKLFMSGDPAEELTSAKLNKVDFRLTQCRLVRG